MRLQLSFMPYVRYDLVKGIQNTLRERAQLPGLPVPHYDPNQEQVSFATAVAGGYQRLEQTGYCPVKVWINFADGAAAIPDALGAPQPGLVSKVSREKLQAVTIEEKTAQASGGRGSSVTRISSKALYVPANTSLVRDASDRSKAAATLYWGTAVDETLTRVIADYSYDWSRGGFVVNETPPSSVLNGAKITLNEVYADYWYVDERPLVQVLSPASTPMNANITRNRTDYLMGSIPELRPYIDGVYEVYEYYVDNQGRLCFHPSLDLFMEREATITVEYESMKLTPRVVLEMQAPTLDVLSVETPRVRGFTVLANTGVLGRGGSKD